VIDAQLTSTSACVRAWHNLALHRTRKQRRFASCLRAGETQALGVTVKIESIGSPVTQIR
jgi:hypothetical protein